MKLNKKGFMMAEVIVVSAVVLITLSTLFVSYSKIYSLYDTRLDYTQVSSLYRLAYYRDKLMSSGSIIDNINYVKTNQVKDLTSEYSICTNDECKDKIFLVYNNKKNFDLDEIPIDKFGSINPTFKDYITDYLTDAIDLRGTEYVMFMEHCDKDNENCKYSYLFLYNECNEKNYEIDGNYYCTLKSAFKAAHDEDTINVLCNNIEKNDAELGTDEELKNNDLDRLINVKLNLNGHEIDMGNNTLYNKGRLDIYSSGNLTSDTCTRNPQLGTGARIIGKSNNGMYGVIHNFGMLTTNVTSDTNEIEFVNNIVSNKVTPRILINDIILLDNNDAKAGEIILNKNTRLRFNNKINMKTDDVNYTTDDNRYMVVNNGELTLNSAILKNSYGCNDVNNGVQDDVKIMSHDAGIVIGDHRTRGKDENVQYKNKTNGNVYVNDDTLIETCSYAINNFYGSYYNTENGTSTIKINSGTVISHIKKTLANFHFGKIDISGGTIKLDTSINGLVCNSIGDDGFIGDGSSVAIYHKYGQFNMSGGKIYSNGCGGINSFDDGKVNIESGNIISSGYVLSILNNEAELSLGNNLNKPVPKLYSGFYENDSGDIVALNDSSIRNFEYAISIDSTVSSGNVHIRKNANGDTVEVKRKKRADSDDQAVIYNNPGINLDNYFTINTDENNIITAIGKEIN